MPPQLASSKTKILLPKSPVFANPKPWRAQGLINDKKCGSLPADMTNRLDRNTQHYSMIRNTLKNALLIFVCAMSLVPVFGQVSQPPADARYQLIAHRGGVVDSATAENSLASLTKAAQAGYWMVEVDLRLTRDSVFVIHHDRDFKRYYGVDKEVSASTWDEISRFRGNFGNRVLTFEEALAFCQENGLQVMVDNKVSGNDTVLFARVVELLAKYDRLENALMIGTTASTPYFTGKIRLSCTRQQLEDNMKMPGFRAENYYLFSKDITQEDVEWTSKHGILAVGVVNAWTYKEEDMMKQAKREVEKLKARGVRHFQLDSMFDFHFR